MSDFDLFSGSIAGAEVQRDLLPIIEGSEISTKYGDVSAARALLRSCLHSFFSEISFSTLFIKEIREFIGSRHRNSVVI